MSLLTMFALLGLATRLQAAPDLYRVQLKTIDGQATTLKQYQGKVLLIVNVASKCGYTPQYMPLEALYQRYRNIGLEILAFPSNDFGGQEPGSNADIKQFCRTEYNVTFPLFEKIRVKGQEKHPLYAALTSPPSPVAGEVKWNFTKFLIGRDGRILKRFESKVSPDDPELIKAVEAAIKTKV